MSEQTGSKVPQIRFSGFQGDWEEKTLGAIGQVAMNKRIFKHQTSEAGDIPFFKIGSFGGVPDSFISRELFEDYKKRYPYPLKGDLLISASGSIGKIVEYKGQDEYFQDSNIVWLKHDGLVENAFLKQFYAFVKWAGLEGSTIKRLYNKSILQTKITLPTPDEQAQIGKYFRELDSLIGLHQRKHDKLVTLKKAMLQKMFPQPGATTPEIRFKGFSSPWDSIEMEKLGQTYSGLFGKSKDDFGRGDGRFVTYMGVFNHTVSNLNVTDAIGVDSSQNEVRKGDVLFTISSETPHEVGMSSVWAGDAKNVYLNSFCFGFRPLPSLKSDFLAYVFRADEFRKRICLLAQGISRYNISKTKVMKIPVSIPDPAEQQKIGTYFRTLDALISQHATQLQKLQQIKSACLAKMFV